VQRRAILKVAQRMAKVALFSLALVYILRAGVNYLIGFIIMSMALIALNIKAVMAVMRVDG